MRKLFIAALMTVCAGTISAQNNAIYKAEALAAEQKFNEAATLLEAALSNPKTTKFAQMYNLAGKVQGNIFNPELMKAAQGMPLDTAIFINAMDKAIYYYTKSHEADVAPDAKGRVKPKFVAENFRMINSMIDYYNYAAMFAYANRDFKASRELFQKYIALPKNPVFSQAQTDSIYAEKRKDYSQAAFNVALLSYNAKEWKDVLTAVDVALEDTLNMVDLYKMKAQANIELGDSAAWLNTLKEAVAKVKNSSAFSQNLLYYYVEKGDVTEAEAMADQLIQTDPSNKMAWYMKGCVELNVKKDFEKARECLQKAIDLDPSFVEANYNIGVSYINEVIARRDKGEFCLDKSKVKEYNASIDKMRVFYEKARPYYERVKELLPDQPRKWAPALQQVYSNLNMKAEADAMDALLQY